MVWLKLLFTDKIFNIIFPSNIYLFKANKKTVENGVKYVQSQKWRH